MDEKERLARIALDNLVAKFPALEPSRFGIADDVPCAAIVGAVNILSHVLIHYIRTAKALGAEYGDFAFCPNGDIYGLFGPATRIVIPSKKVLKEICAGARVKQNVAKKLIKWLFAAVRDLEPNFVLNFERVSALPATIKLVCLRFNPPPIRPS